MNVDFSKIKKGDKFSHISFGEIVQTKGKSVVLKTETGSKFEIHKTIFEKEFKVHDQFKSTETLSQTDLINLFKRSLHNVMTVCFYKKPDPKFVKKQMMEIKKNAESGKFDPSQMEKLIEYSLYGEERVMIGRHYGNTDSTGRIQFTDMEAKNDSGNIRLVDPRTISYMIYNGVKYIKSSK